MLIESHYFLFVCVYILQPYIFKFTSLCHRPLGPENLLLRGARLKNTREIFGESVRFEKKNVGGEYSFYYELAQAWIIRKSKTELLVWCPCLGFVMWDNASGLRIQLDKTCNQSHRDDCMFADSNNKSVCRICANLESLPQTGSTQDALLTRMDFMLDAAS